MAHVQHIKHVENGKSAVLFIHGFLGSPEHYCDYIPHVPENTAIYNILLEGHGGAARDFSKASMEIWKKQVSEAVDMLSERYQDVFITAHSMGTFLAMHEAVRSPEKIKGLFLLAIPMSIGLRPAAFVNTVKSLFGIVREDDETGKAYCESHSVKLTLRLWEYIGWIPRYLELFSESSKSRETIKNVTVPVRIFQSRNDELVKMKSLEYIPARSNISVTVLENSAHFIYDKKDKEYLLSEFSKMLRDD